jgi:hypothetical protein
MGYNYYSIDDMPAPGTIVWCRWPYADDNGKPGTDVRAVLVRKNSVRLDRSGIKHGELTVSYGTGVLSKHNKNLDLFIDSYSEYKAAGLHKPTCFSLREANKKTYPWCEEYFAPQRYVLNAPLIAGSLTEVQRERLRECLRQRTLLR